MPEMIHSRRLMNIVAFSADGLTWNDIEIDQAGLQKNLAQSKRLLPQPIIVLDPTNAPNCENAKKLQSEIHKSIDCEGTVLCGIGTKAEWDAVNQ